MAQGDATLTKQLLGDTGDAHNEYRKLVDAAEYGEPTEGAQPKNDLLNLTVSIFNLSRFSSVRAIFGETTQFRYGETSWCDVQLCLRGVLALSLP